jgi:hypothetical protein
MFPAMQLGGLLHHRYGKQRRATERHRPRAMGELNRLGVEVNIRHKNPSSDGWELIDCAISSSI